MRATVGGNAARKRPASQGRYSVTCSTPTFSPWAFSHAAVSSSTSNAEPMTITTRSASG